MRRSGYRALGLVALASLIASSAWPQTFSLGAGRSFPAGVLPTGIASGNFNSDGKPDVAVTNQNGVSILLNDGSGGLLSPQSYVTGTNPQHIAVGDFNGDGKLDLVVVNQGSGNVTILIGAGNGTFSSAGSFPAGNNPRWVVVADFNHDGKADLAVVNSGPPSGVSILLGNGDGTFPNASFFAAGSVSVSVAAGDFNGDNNIDLVVANSGSDNISVLFGNGNGTFQTAVNYNLDQPGISVSPTAVAVGDLNGDGKLDLAIATPNVHDVAVMLGNPGGTFQSAIHYPLEDPNFVNNRNTLVLVDLNGDGRPDIVLDNLSSNHVTVMVNSGSGTFPTAKSYAAGPEPNCIVVDDFNGDGKPDIAAADNTVDGVATILIGAGGGIFNAAPLFRSGMTPQAIAVGDLNGDGKLDVVTAGGLGNGAAMLGNGDGTFKAPVVWSAAAVTSVALSDVNGDGKLDVIATNTVAPHGNVQVFIGNGNGTFQSGITYPAGSTPRSVTVVDLNGDGKPDIIVANHDSQNVSVLMGTGGGAFASAVNYPIAINGTPDSIVVADFNGDGKLDLAVGVSGVNATTVALLLGNGNGTFQNAIPFAIGFFSPQTLTLAAGDFNGDGKMDIAASEGATLAVLIGNGNGSFQNPANFPLVSNGAAINGTVVTGEFNGDGKLDIAVSTRDGILFFLGNGGGGFSAPVTYNPFLGGAIAVGDFNGDGRPDLIAADSIQDQTPTNTIALILNTTVLQINLTIGVAPANQASVYTTFPSQTSVPCTSVCTYQVNWGDTIVFSVGSISYFDGHAYDFASWTDGNKTNPRTITVPSTPVSYTANLELLYVLYTGVSPGGGGSVTPAPPFAFEVAGTVVPITATPNPGYIFNGWTGPVTTASNASTTVTMDAAKTVTANFQALSGIPPTNGLRFVPVTPCRIADTRNPNGPFGGPAFTSNSSRSFVVPSSACGIPASAAAYSLNLTVVPSGGLGFLQVYPTGQAQPPVSTLNSSDGRIKANAAIVPAGTGGAITIFASNPTNVIIDINGYFISDPNDTALAFYPMTPCRVADTRNPAGTFGAPALAPNTSRDFPILSSGCGVPGNARAYALNMTIVPPGAVGFLSTWPAGSSQPGVSTLNDPTGAVVANAAIVPSGTGGAISVFATHTTNLIIDINGYFAPPGLPGALAFFPLNPCRIMDTRNANGTFGGPILAAGVSRDIPIVSSGCGAPATAKAYSLNATVVPPAGLGFLQLWNTGGAQPGVSTLNDGDATIVANAAIIPAGTGGSVTTFASNATHLILDINGYFAP